MNTSLQKKRFNILKNKKSLFLYPFSVSSYNVKMYFKNNFLRDIKIFAIAFYL